MSRRLGRFIGMRTCPDGPEVSPGSDCHETHFTLHPPPAPVSTYPMALTVLIVPDKFKGTLTASQAARAMAAGWRRVRPQDQLDLLPMSDGGDGFGSVLSHLVKAQPRTRSTVDAAHRACRARWWWAGPERIAVIESALVIGLAMLPASRRRPFELDTTGLGQLLRAVAQTGTCQCLIGIGGSATNDGGFGMARALDWQFLDRAGSPIQQWVDLTGLHRIVPPRPDPIRALQTTVAVDVQNRLLGPKGATRVYGPQKGLQPDDLPRAENALRRLAHIWHQQFDCDLGNQPGAGAAGGLGFGLMAFARAKSVAGSELFARYASLESRLKRADLVLTGEGSIDASSLMGKGVGDIARRCRQHRLPCIGLAGVLKDVPALRRGFTAVHCLTPGLTTSDQALSRPAYWLATLTARVARDWHPKPSGR
jgi:glycerate 2-kinase